MFTADKKVVRCFGCNDGLRIPSDKHIIATCPNCKEKFEAKNGVIINSSRGTLNQKYATFWQRVGARVIDVVISSLVFFILFYNAISELDEAYVYRFEQAQNFLGMCFFFLIYYPILEYNGGTIGKQIIGIKPVLIESRTNPTIIDTYKRSLFLIAPMLIGVFVLLLQPFSNEVKELNYAAALLFMLLSSVTLLIGPLTMVWSKNNQGWHDMFSKIVVVKT
ncbi:RDD family protein [Pontibacter sp. FD36]|uniref:RDD family protein n=1 Tax=Pontibacter sp. FD36 TaxID=2789860 RepID=UPI0018AC8D39|nr:RDD family protein [Pontibacter sp. FD36]MBF8962994.1 RDD family protein [Pontibacter sp. FD36]